MENLNFFFDLRFVNVDLSMMLINLRWSDTPVSSVFTKLNFLIVRKLPIKFILLKFVGLDNTLIITLVQSQ